MMRIATMEDLNSIMTIISKVVIEMNGYNNFQWDENYPQEKDFIGDINRGDLFVSLRAEKIVGFICINRDQPVEYTGLNWSLVEDALVVHRMAVDPEIRKAGVGFELVSFADELATQNKVRYLKTDTYSLNTSAQGLFKKLGYIFVGEMSFLSKEKPFYCYEKTIEVQREG